MRIILLGSPQYVVPTFEIIRKHFTVVAVITQPPKPQGRGFKLEPTPVATWASSHNLPLFSPSKIKTILPDLKALSFDLMLTFSYGQIIPQAILDLGSLPPLNIHGSILPKYRGAAPVHHAVLNGDSEIGITLMQMVAAMDAGPMFFVAKSPLRETATTSEAISIIASLAEANIVKWLKAVAAGQAIATPQPSDFTLSPKLDKAMQELSPNVSCQTNLRIIRALSEHPGAFTYFNNKRIKVFQAQTKLLKNAPNLRCLDGTIYFSDYQFDSKKRVKLIH